MHVKQEDMMSILNIYSHFRWVVLCNYTLYKNAGFWLVNSRDIFLQIQALHCEFAEFLLHVGVFT